MEKNSYIAIGLLLIAAGVGVGYLIQPNEGPRGGYRMAANVDQHFIEEMIPHHEGAIAMAKLALERSERPEVRSLAEDIIEAQTREIDQMKSWYAEWYGGVPAETGHGMHMDSVSGDVGQLQNTADFDREFVQQMIPHHEMAVMMAQMLAAGTERNEMKVLADQIITSQSREIALMRSWLASW